MVSVFDVHPELLIQETARDLREKFNIKKPAFADFVKTGANKERAPLDPEWYYVRMASILRRVYVDGPVGVESLRTYYGGRKARGTKPHEFRKASGKIIRLCLQELEKLGFVEKDKNKEGRKITGKGEKYLAEKAKHVDSITEKWLRETQEKKEMKEAERKKKPQTAEEKKEQKREKKETGSKKKKGEEEDDPTAVKLKKQSKK